MILSMPVQWCMWPQTKPISNCQKSGRKSTTESEKGKRDSAVGKQIVLHPQPSPLNPTPMFNQEVR